MEASQDQTQDRRLTLERVLLLLGWGALLGFLCVRGLGRASVSDFRIIWHVLDGAGGTGSLYSGPEWWKALYFYGPVFTVLARPFAWVSFRPAFALWIAAMAVSLPVTAVVTRKALKVRFGKELSPWVFFGAAILIIVPLASDFRHANINMMLLLLHALVFLCLSTGRNEIGGGLLALAVTLKVTPVVFLPWLILRKNWRGVGGFLIGLLLWIVIVPSLAYGPRRAMEDTRLWVGTVLFPVARSADEVSPEALLDSGASLWRVVITVLADDMADQGEAGPDSRPTPRLRVLSAGKTKVIAYALALGIMLLTLLITRREPGAGLVGFGVLAAAALLVSPVSRCGHFIQLYPLAACLMAMSFEGKPPETLLARRTLLTAILVLFLLLGVALTASYTSEAFFYITGYTLVLWIGGVLIVRAGLSRCEPETEKCPEGPESSS